MIPRTALALLLLAATARASEPEMLGHGARSGAMAGTGAADADGYDSTYANPAGLVEPTRRRLTFGYVAARFNLKLGGAPRGVESTNGVLIGAAVPLPFGGVMKDRLGIGISFYFPTAVLNRASSPFPHVPRLALLETRTQVVSALASIGARIHPRFSVGIGVLVLATLVGEIRIAPDAAGRITTLAEEQMTTFYAPIVGARVRVLDSLRIGAVFRGTSQARYDILIKSRLGDALPLEIPDLRIAGVAQYDPMQIAVEAAWRAARFLSITAGVTWKHWSAYPIVSENAAPGTPDQPAPGFHDTAVPRAAVELTRAVGPVDLIGRAGYFFEWSPSPRSQTVLVDADRHVATFGGGAAWRHRYGTLQLDLFGQVHALAGSPLASGTFWVLGGTLGVDL